MPLNTDGINVKHMDSFAPKPQNYFFSKTDVIAEFSRYDHSA